MKETASPPDNRIDLTQLLLEAREGNEDAFNSLMKALSPPILSALRRQGASADDSEDALSNAMIIVHRLLRQNRFEEMQTGGFIAYFRKVAVHEWLHRAEARRNAELVCISMVDSDTGETIELDVPDRSTPIADRIANLSLYDFLLRQLDEVFVAGRSGADRCRGELEKVAFVYYYQDGLTQNEIYDIVSLLGAGFPRMTPITRADLNNWLSMGRSLKALLKHLAEHHGELVGMLVDLHLSSLSLAPGLEDLLRAIYRDGWTVEQFAAAQSLDAAATRQAMARGKKELVEGLARTIKAQLKVSRSG